MQSKQKTIGRDFFTIDGQASAIRTFDPDSKTSHTIIKRILSAKQVKKWMDDAGRISFSDYQDWATLDPSSLLYSVHDARLSDAARAKIRGFVFLYNERSEKFRLKRMQEARFVNLKESAIALEASFALKPIRGKQSGSGLMSSALRLTCERVFQLATKEHFFDETLEKPAFWSKKRKTSLISQDDILIFGFIDPENISAHRTLYSAGFRKVGSMKYDATSPQESSLYILNWRALHKKLNLAKNAI